MHLRWIVPAVLGAMLACQPPSPSSSTSPRRLSTAGTSPTGGFESAIVFAGVGAQVGACNHPELWVAGRGFRMTPLFRTSGNPSGRLDAYCRLDLVQDPANLGWPGRDLLAEAITLLFGGAARIGPDHVGLAQTPPHPGPLVDAGWKQHWGRFMNNVGAFRAEELSVAAAPRIALIDSAPSASRVGWTANRPLDDYLDHGLTLARLAEELLCEDGNASGPCLAEIVSEQAMTHTPRGVQGSLGDLARAIVQVVMDAPDPRALSINLSLGWVNPRMGGDLGDIFEHPAEEPAAAAVHEALQYARCRGAAIFAAAGNRVGAFDGLESGLIRPAHWSASLEDTIDCGAEFGLQGVVYGRLVTAVGAITDTDAPLAVSREHAEPPLVAPGLFAVAPTQTRAQTPTALLSGTSVASIVAAVQTAVLQHVRPFDDVQSIEATLTGSARSLGRLADGGTGTVHAVHLIGSLPAQSLTARVPSATTPGSTPRTIALPAGQGVWTSCWVAGVQVPVFGDPDDVKCAWLAYESVDERPYTHPQPLPTGGGCPGCAFRLVSSGLQLDFPAGSHAVPAFLEIIDNAGSFYLALPRGLAAGHVYDVGMTLPRTLGPSARGRVLSVNPSTESVTATEIRVWN